jgi:hypothetical protein
VITSHVKLRVAINCGNSSSSSAVLFGHDGNGERSVYCLSAAAIGTWRMDTEEDVRLNAINAPCESARQGRLGGWSS